ncbi:MAG TPA: PmoA family protein, partial [Gemmataceae bacterium]|nr:PmoA family protein [Gemmataceae bacterium]
FTHPRKDPPMRCRWLFALAVFASPLLAKADDVSAVKGKDAIEFKSGSAVVAKYNHAPSWAKPFLYPVLAPGEVPVTRAWPVEKGTPGEKTNDHVHQKSAWFCHGDVIPEGIELKVKSANKGDHGVDFWSEAKDKDGSPRHGTIVCVKVGEPQQVAKNHVKIATTNEWKTPDGIKIMDEERVLHFIDLPSGRLFVFEITLKASVCPIVFGDTKEGSFGVRVHDALRTEAPDGGTVTASDGTTVKAPAKDNLPVWGQVSLWNDYSGTVNGKAVGISVFSAPDNPPAAWHTRGYGLMAANPFGRNVSGFPSQKGKTELVRIEKGKEMKLRYAIFAHTGDAQTGKVAEAYEVFKK